MVTVRAATQQDAVGIAHVHVESWRTTYAGIVPVEYLASLDERERELQWKEWLTLDIQSFVAAEADEIVGFASGGPIREPIKDYDAELFAIYLLKQAQGRGIGTALLKTLATSLQSKNYKCMAAWVLRSNASTHFYEKTGAFPISTKQIEIGAAMLPVISYGWPDLKTIGGFSFGS
jgi:L-amino acid N-acyltransferase YncA